jgi:hypothetical protein
MPAGMHTSKNKHELRQTPTSFNAERARTFLPIIDSSDYIYLLPVSAIYFQGFRLDTQTLFSGRYDHGGARMNLRRANLLKQRTQLYCNRASSIGTMNGLINAIVTTSDVSVERVRHMGRLP